MKEAIFDAVEKGDLAALEAWIAEGNDIDYADDRKRTLLMLAAQEGHAPIVKLLLKKGASLSVADRHKYIPARYAALSGDLATVQLFMERGFSIKADISGHGQGETWLLMAAGKGTPELITHLLELGADVNQPLHNGITPLIRAAYSGNVDACRLLLEAGADIGAKEHFNNSDALSSAAHNNQKEVAHLLLDYGAPQTAKALFEALDFDEERNMESVIERMLDQDPQLVNVRGHLQTTPLMRATHWHWVSIVKLLLEKGAQVNDQDNDKGWSALMHATYCVGGTAFPRTIEEYNQIIDMLKEAGASDELTDKKGHDMYDLMDDFYDYDND